MDIVEFNKSNNQLKEGEEILKKNEFFTKLIALMNSNEFIDFYDSYFKDWSDIETIVFYIKLYKTIEYEYRRRLDTDIPQGIMTYTLYNIINNNEMRKIAIKKFSDFKDHKTIDMKKNEDFRYLLDFNLPIDNNSKLKDK
tara:strand:+ start:42 stop:461 length:420 start_codon:yes stop_codon:yes gene_type:complete